MFKEDLILLLKYADEYNRGLEWFSWDNWFEEDVFVGTPEGIPKGMDWVMHETRLKATAKTVVRKARYTDLKDILDFYVRKGKSYSLMKRELYYHFLLGSVYSIYNASSEVVGSFSVSLSKMTDYYSPCIEDILYSKKYYLAMKYALSILLNNIKRKSPGLVDTVSISIFYKEDVCDILNHVLECKPNPIPDEYFIDEAQGEMQFYLGVISKISTTKLSGEASLRKYLKATEKGYRQLINKRNEEVRNFVSNDVYEKIKEYM